MLYNLKSVKTLAQGWKSSIFVASSSILTAALILLSVSSSSASEEKSNYIGPSINFINDTTLYGVTAKFRVADNVSARPFVQFANSGAGTLGLYGVGVSYDLNIPNSGLVPYVGGGYVVASNTGNFIVKSADYLELGAEYNASESIAINANYKTNSWFNFNVGYRF
jgi:hypothetical protein